MISAPAALWRRWVELFEEEGPDEPFFDPIHLATVLVVCVVVIGAVYWLLWGALVYEGGLDAKLLAWARGARGREALEGWVGNALCAGGAALAAAALVRSDRLARKKR